MKIWHLTADAPRIPHQAMSGQRIRLQIGSAPVAPGQSVWAVFTVHLATGALEHRAAKGIWLHNEGERSYWEIELGPFGHGDRVEYTILAEDSPGRVIAGTTQKFTVQEAPARIARFSHSQV